MKVVGIVGRSYYNKDNQEIIQINDYIRNAFSKYEDVCCIGILPTNDKHYTDLEMGTDKLEEVDKAKLNFILDKCDAFVIPGGSSWYNFDEYVIEYAIKNNKSLLAICAGFQALCSMYSINRDKFDMTNRVEDTIHYGEMSQYKHTNKIIDNTRLKSIIGSDKIKVNSIHHSGITTPIHTLKISSISEDNLIEAVELDSDNFVLGVQWHPEYLLDENSIKIFDSFINSIH